MTRIAPFEPQRFASAIPHYVAGRPAYCMHLVERLARETGLAMVRACSISAAGRAR